MTTATYASVNTTKPVRIDPVYPAVSHNDLWVGTANGADPTKWSGNRSFLLFDLTQPPYSGTDVPPGADVADAFIQCKVYSLAGLVSQLAVIERVTQDWYGYDHTTWTNYDTGNAWATPGGDVDALIAATFTSPAAPTVSFGQWFVIPGLAAMVADALENRGRQLKVRLRNANEDYAHVDSSWKVSTTDDPPNGYYPPQLVISFGATQPIDERDDAKLPGDRPARPSVAPGAARPAQPFRVRRGR